MVCGGEKVELIPFIPFALDGEPRLVVEDGSLLSGSVVLVGLFICTLLERAMESLSRKLLGKSPNLGKANEKSLPLLVLTPPLVAGGELWPVLFKDKRCRYSFTSVVSLST